jgi:hypothetical protein
VHLLRGAVDAIAQLQRFLLAEEVGVLDLVEDLPNALDDGVEARRRRRLPAPSEDLRLRSCLARGLTGVAAPAAGSRTRRPPPPRPHQEAHRHDVLVPQLLQYYCDFGWRAADCGARVGWRIFATRPGALAIGCNCPLAPEARAARGVAAIGSVGLSGPSAFSLVLSKTHNNNRCSAT